jgi:hypothetical protein
MARGGESVLRDECARFEACLARGKRPGEELREHAARCPDCSLLASVAALTISAVPAAEDDPLLRAALAAAGRIADSRAARLERQRRLVLLLLGLFGYLLGAVGFAATLVHSSGRQLTPTMGAGPGLALPVVPPPSGGTVLFVLLACALWIIGVVVLTQRRDPESRAAGS